MSRNSSYTLHNAPYPIFSPAERYQRFHEKKAKGGLNLTMFGGSSNVAPDSPVFTKGPTHGRVMNSKLRFFCIEVSAVDGGEFQYFLGTRDEMAELHTAGKSIPPERVVAPPIPGAGYAVLIQGNYVVHQACGCLLYTSDAADE